MDRTHESGAAGSPPSPPASPSSGYPTAGNPQTATPATKPGPWWYHMVTEELRAVIVAAGLTPDHAILTQLRDAIKALSIAGQCRLIKSGSNLVLVPYKGNLLTIGGPNHSVPAAGVSLAPGGLVAATTYYIYAYMSSDVMMLEASVTGHSTDAATGVEIKTGDATRTLVGMARTTAGTAWADIPEQQFVRSWFNGVLLLGGRAVQAVRQTASGTPAETNPADRAEFLCWAGEVVALKFDGAVANSIATPATSNYVHVWLDGAGVGCIAETGAPGANIYSSITSLVARVTPGEGYHYVSPAINQTEGGTMGLLSTYSAVSLWGGV